MKPDEAKRRHGILKSQRQTVNETWDAIERYIAPYRGRFFKDERSENSIEWRKPFVYDSTAVMAAQSLAAHLHTALTSPAIKWFDMRFRNETLSNDREAARWLEACSNITYENLQDSNFTVEAGETYQDLVDFGTSVIVEEASNPDLTAEWEGLDFSSIPIKECYFEQDHKGNILNFYRELEWTPLQIVAKFGKDKVPAEILKDAEDSVEQKEIVLFVIFKRENFDKTIDLSQPVAPDKLPFGYQWVLLKDASPLAKEGGYYEMPAYVPRWRKTSSSMWGNSPAMIALSDTMTLNRLIELMMQSMEKAIDPATLVTERALITDLDLNPGGLTVVRSLDEIDTHESGARFDVCYQEIERYRNQIREYFMLDQLMLPPMEGTPATATEIQARIAQLERLIGPTLGRLQKDFLDPCISRTFNILFRAGRFPDMPQIVAENANDLNVEYVGPMALAQKQDQVQALDTWIMTLMGMAEAHPEVLDIPEWDEVGKDSGTMRGVAAKYIKAEQAIKKMREERAAQQQAMQEAAMAQEQGAGLKAIGEGAQAVKESPIDMEAA